MRVETYTSDTQVVLTDNIGEEQHSTLDFGIVQGSAVRVVGATEEAIHSSN